MFIKKSRAAAAAAADDDDDNNNNNNNTPQSVKTNHEGEVTISWNQQVQTNRTIPDNTSDSIIHDSEKGICTYIC